MKYIDKWVIGAVIVGVIICFCFQAALNHKPSIKRDHFSNSVMHLCLKATRTLPKEEMTIDDKTVVICGDGAPLVVE